MRITAAERSKEKGDTDGARGSMKEMEMLELYPGKYKKLFRKQRKKYQQLKDKHK